MFNNPLCFLDSWLSIGALLRQKKLDLLPEYREKYLKVAVCFQIDVNSMETFPFRTFHEAITTSKVNNAQPVAALTVH